jgi:putative PIN family toxin of toxin-antitoxin system
MIVIDTNIVLDMFVFNDPASLPLRQALQQGLLRWPATQAMRDELERVLAYPQIVQRMAHSQVNAADVLAQFDRHTQLTPDAPKAAVTCSDADDQKFIDLAVAYRATLLSKDRAVTCMAKRLVPFGVRTQTTISLVA